MITIEEMKKAVGHKVLIYLTNGKKEESFIESYQYEPDDDREPFLLFTPNRADYQSNIKRIEIID